MSVSLTSSFFFADSLSWSVKQATGVYRGSSATLEWTVSLSAEEKSRSDRFALILLEREMFLYSNLWQIMVVKQFSSGVHQEIGNDDAFDVIPGNDMKLQLKNITDTDATRFRCTFLSSFAAPKSIVELEIKGEVLLFVDNNVIPACDSVSCTLSGVCESRWYSLKSSLVLLRCSLQFIRILKLKAELLQHLHQLEKLPRLTYLSL